MLVYPIRSGSSWTYVVVLLFKLTYKPNGLGTQWNWLYLLFCFILYKYIAHEIHLLRIYAIISRSLKGLIRGFFYLVCCDGVTVLEHILKADSVLSI